MCDNGDDGGVDGTVTKVGAIVKSRPASIESTT
jgi:hypothetical protein